MPGPLSGVRVIEIGSIGPGPFCGMMLADHGAEVIRIDRPGTAIPRGETLLRNRKWLMLDLKSETDVAAVRDLARTADVVIEGFRPGTLERLRLGPDTLLADNPRLVVGRMTGWGQTGPYSHAAGHDINYIALSGALHLTGPDERPVAPPAMLGDFGGGGMLLAFAITAALLHARQTGVGQIIDCAMTEGSGLLAGAFYGLYGMGEWKDRRSANVLDGGAHFYGVYRTADDKFVSIGALEPQFYRLLLERLGLADDPSFARQLDSIHWPILRDRLQAIFLTKTRDEWCLIMEHSDICFAPVLGLGEAPSHPHAVARRAFVDVDGTRQPAPAPRYSATPLAAPRPALPTALEPLLSARM